MLKAVAWEALSIGLWKLNPDRSALGCPGRVGAASIIRDESGRWANGFTRFLGEDNNTIAKSWALRGWPHFSKGFRNQNLLVELDAKIIVNLFHVSVSMNHLLTFIILDCRIINEAFEKFHLRYVYREAHKVADYLAKRTTEPIG